MSRRHGRWSCRPAMVLAGLLSVLLLSACEPSQEPADTSGPSPPAERTPSSEGSTAPQPEEPARPADPYQAALDHPGRSRADRERDRRRRPAAVARFLGIAPGMEVLDLFSGGGYYSEYLSRLVGPEGRVVAHNNRAYLHYAVEELSGRFVPGRLPGVERLQAEAPGIELPERRFDAVVMMLAYHDLYYVQGPDWPEVDAADFMREVYESLEPGGILGIVDHAAEPGSGMRDAQSLHRIDRDRVIADLTALGFVLEAESELLANPEDPRDGPVFDTGLRGRTDRFVLRFRRPAP